MDLSLRRLRIFLMLAETRHFGRAAQRLHMSQPAVSQELRKLERELDVRLFDRTSRSVELTPAGERLVDDARLVLAAARRAVEQVRSIDRTDRATLRLVHSPSVTDGCLPAVMRALERHAPHLHVIEREVNTGEVAVAVANHEDDIGLCRFPEQGLDLASEPVRSEPMVAVISHRHALAGRNQVSLAELSDDPLLLWQRSQAPQYHDYLVGACRDAGFEPLLLLAPPRGVGRSYLLAEGRAFALLPESSGRNLGRGTVAVALRESVPLPLHLVYARADTRPEVVTAIAVIRRLARAEGWITAP